MPLESTTTGIAAGQRCLAMAARLIGGEIPATIGRRLDAAVRAAEEGVVRLSALERTVEILDGGTPLSTWKRAQRLAELLERFESVAYRRITSGCRTPTELESCLVVLVETSQRRCAGKLWEELRGAGL